MEDYNQSLKKWIFTAVTLTLWPWYLHLVKTCGDLQNTKGEINKSNLYNLKLEMCVCVSRHHIGL